MSVARATLVMSWAVAAVLACGSGGNQKAVRNNGAECNPYACECLPSCICAFVERRDATDDQPATCVGAPLCNTLDDCPETDFETRCVPDALDDAVLGATGICVLTCEAEADCPSGMLCIERACVFAVPS